ncbi:hypothetical protein Pcinc_025657 [Petrolisthes cinctipes]|uniref:Uncharacterized protein n=1 Tax=Petrolisthes cinctipes TaxID=88211 RepID=A0AAE1F8E3_PETCI|nr:hypothetical protein Pcinc_025657 [Petrolisthes cinctipes]
MDVLGVFPHTQASRWTHEERHLPWDQDQYRNEVVTLPSLSPRPHSSCGVVQETEEPSLFVCCPLCSSFHQQQQQQYKHLL